MSSRQQTGFLQRWLLRFVINAAALFAAAEIIPGISVADWRAVLLAALIFGLINAFIRPLVDLVTCLVQALTLGLFTLVVNALMLWATSWVAGELGVGFRVAGFWPAFWGALTISVVSFILTRLVR